MKRVHLKSPQLALLFRMVLGLLFVFAGLAKIADPISFFATLMGFRLFPDPVLPILAVFLPWLELLIGLSLVLGLLVRTGALMLVCLNLLFSLAIVSVILRGIEIDCGCFGMFSDILYLPDQADMKAVVRNLVFIGMSIIIYRSNETILSLERYMKGRR